MSSITYNGANRPVRFRNEETDTTVDCGYDSQGRRYFKKVTVAGTVTLHHRYIYRGYLQIACVDCTRSGHPTLWFVTWDPSQPTATRPLAIQKDGTWFTYGYDLTKNICEVFGPAGYIRTAYAYAPFGAVSTSDNSVVQPFQWSSEYYDSELDLVYYNFRHYSPSLGRFLSRDPIEEQGGLNLYMFVGNQPSLHTDLWGALPKAAYRPMDKMEWMGDFAIIWHAFVLFSDGKTDSNLGPEGSYRSNYTVYVDAKIDSTKKMLNGGSCRCENEKSIEKCVRNYMSNPKNRKTKYLIDNNCGSLVRDAFLFCCLEDPTPWWLYYPGGKYRSSI